jgi:hypothetical protein
MSYAKVVLSYCVRKREDEDTKDYMRKHYRSLTSCMILNVTYDTESLVAAYMNKEAIHWILEQARAHKAKLI